jgi:hypothetical protein
LTQILWRWTLKFPTPFFRLGKRRDVEKKKKKIAAKDLDDTTANSCKNLKRMEEILPEIERYFNAKL